MKKVFAVLFALTLVLGMTLSAIADVTYPLVKDGEEITLNVVWGKPATSKPIAEMKVVKDVQDISGVKLNVIEIPEDGFGEKRNLMIASGDLPDVFMEGIGKTEILNYKDQGVFIPVTDLIENYMPNLKKILDTHPEYKAAMVAPDGEIWGFPRIEEMYGLVCNQGILSINKDWLNKLGLSMPTTIDEFKQCLIAFRDGDPNGNGIKDEIPFLYRMGESRIGSWRNNQSIGQFFGCWGQADTGDRLYVKDGKIFNTATTDAYKEGLKWFNGLWNEGLLDPAMALNDEAGYRAKLNTEDVTVGAVMYFSIVDVMPKERRAQYAAVPYLKGPGGEFGCKDNISEMHSVVSAAITTACKHPEIAASLIDLFYDPQRSVEANWGAIGEYYQLDDKGVMQWVDQLPEGFESYSALRTYCTTVEPSIVLNEYYDTVVSYPEDATDLYNDMRTAGFVDKHLQDPIVPPNMWYDPADQEEMNLIAPQIYNLIDNFNATAITDGNVDGAWDAYLQSLKDAGLDRFLEIVQKTYDAYALQLDKFVAGTK